MVLWRIIQYESARKHHQSLRTGVGNAQWLRNWHWAQLDVARRLDIAQSDSCDRQPLPSYAGRRVAGRHVDVQQRVHGCTAWTRFGGEGRYVQSPTEPGERDQPKEWENKPPGTIEPWVVSQIHAWVEA